jgi:hypothetical protein
MIASRKTALIALLALAAFMLPILVAGVCCKRKGDFGCCGNGPCKYVTYPFDDDTVVSAWFTLVSGSPLCTCFGRHIGRG